MQVQFLWKLQTNYSYTPDYSEIPYMQPAGKVLTSDW